MTTKLDIRSARAALGMSQTDLAERLGISRPTLIKMEKGQRVVSIEEGEKLREILGEATAAVADPSDLRINIPQKNVAKFRQVLLYVLGKTAAKPNVGQTVIYKLLYFIDLDYYEKYEEQLMGLTYIRNRFGPTPREFAQVVDEMKRDHAIEEVKSTYFTYEQRKFLPVVNPNLKLLNAQELEMIDSVIDRYSDLSANELSALTHEDTPWLAAEEGQNIEYDHVFYRPQMLSVRQYPEL